MRAGWLKEFGSWKCSSRPTPPIRCRVLIEVAFVNITFVETQFRAGGGGPFRAELPMIPGTVSVV